MVIYKKLKIGINILNDINSLLFRNKSHCKEQSQAQDIPFKEWAWHDGAPLDHTFYKPKAGLRVRVNTVSTTARRKVAPVTIPLTAAMPSNFKITRKETKKRPKSAIVKSNSFILPFKDQSLKIQPSRPCHILKVYDNEPKLRNDNLKSLKLENMKLKQRLLDLESGIVKVSHVLTDQDKLPNLPARPDQEFINSENDGSSVHGNVDVDKKKNAGKEINSKHEPSVSRKHKKTKKSRKKSVEKENLKNLLITVEASLANLTLVLDKIQTRTKLKISS